MYDMSIAYSNYYYGREIILEVKKETLQKRKPVVEIPWHPPPPHIIAI